MTQTRQRLTADARRQAVLETACRVFSRSSYRGATTAEIAREAGISEPILYRHFGSKRDLYLACLEHAYDELVAVAESARREDPDGCLGKVWKAYMKSSARVRLVDLWIQGTGIAADDKVIAKALKRQIRELHAVFADVIREQQAAGVIHADRDPVAEAWLFIAGGMLATFDDRLGGLLGDGVERVRAERRRWLLTNPDVA
jgi:TetR/AcrR family transcriptional regulator